MAEQLTWTNLRELAGFRSDGGCAISLYVDLDPADSPTPTAVDTRVNSLLSEAEKLVESRHDELSHTEREGLKRDFARLREFFDNEFSREGARGLGVFVSGNFFRPVPVAGSVPDDVHVGRTFHLAPVAQLVGRDDGAIVAFIGRERGQHLKDVAAELDRVVRRLQTPKVVIVGSEETRSEFVEALPHEVKSVVVGMTEAEAHSGPNELLEVVQPLLEEAEAADEHEALERWREEIGTNGRGASGWADTLTAASDARVELLLPQEGADKPAHECPLCGRVSLEAGECPLDGTPLEPRKSGFDLALRQTLLHGGSLLEVRHQADLESADGVGALLRF
jgi:peptide subunit release factor 1 (eRF1)